MKKITIVIIFALSAFNILAQNAKINWGADFATSKYNPTPTFYSKNNKELRSAHYDYKEKVMVVSKYDVKTLSKLDDVPVNIVINDGVTKDEQKMTIVDYYGVNEDLFIFSLLYDKKSDLSSLYCTKIDKNLKTSDAVLVDQISAEKKSEAYSYSVYLSTDSSRFVIMKNPEQKKNEKDVYLFKLIDTKTLKGTASFSYTTTTSEKNTTFKNVIFNGEGVMFLLITAKNEDAKEKNRKTKNKEEKIEQYSFKMITANPSRNYEVKEYKVSVPGKDLIDLSLRYNAQTGKVYGIGTYSNLKKSGKAEWGLHGFAYMVMDEDKVALEKSSFKDFSEDLIVKIAGERAARKDKGITSSFEIKDVITKPDGGLYMIMEEDWVQVVTTTSSNGNGGTTTTTTYYYHNEDVLVTYINPSGSITWFSHIPKNQVTANDGGYRNSIYAHLINNKLHIVFNGSKEIIEMNDVSKGMTFAKGKCAIIDVVVDKEGDYKITEINNISGENEYTITPKSMQKISPNEAVLLGYKAFKKKSCFSCGCFALFRKKQADDIKMATIKFD
jgi:hypothetical protein